MKYFSIAVIATVLLMVVCCRQRNADDAAGGNGIVEAEAALSKGQSLNSVSKYEDAIAALKEGLAHSASSDSLAGQLLAELSVSFIMNGDMDSGLVYGRRALPLVKASGNAETFVVTCGNVGIAYRRVGMNDSAMVCYKEGLEMALKSGDDESAAYLYNNLSVLYCELERYDEALRYARDAQKSAKKCGEDVELCSGIANEGIAYSKKGDDAEAIGTLTEAYRKAKELDSLPLKLKLINHVIAAYLKTGDMDSLAYYMAEGESLAAMLPPESIAAMGILQSRANVLLKTGKFRDALEAYDRIGKVNTSMPSYKVLEQKSRCYAGLGDYRRAFGLLQRSVAQSDSVRAADAEKKLSEYTAKFKTYEKELEIARLSEANMRQDVLISKIVASVIVAFAILLLLAVYLLYRRRLNRQRTEMLFSRKYIDGLESERSRLARELHDGVCNDLLALGMELRSGNAGNTGVIERLEKTRSDLRQISHDLIPPSFKFAGLDEILRDYCSHLVLPGNLEVDCDIEDYDWRKLPVGTAYELYRITQEAVANIIKHSGATKALVKLARESGCIVLTVEDNGSSCGNSSDSGSVGVGLRTIGDRAKSIGARCEWDCLPAGSKLQITVNVNEKSE